MGRPDEIVVMMSNTAHDNSDYTGHTGQVDNVLSAIEQQQDMLIDGGKAGKCSNSLPQNFSERIQNDNVTMEDIKNMQRTDGMNYAPTGKSNIVCGKGDFRFAAIGLDHGHIYGMCNGLLEGGAELVKVYDPDPEKVVAFCKTYDHIEIASSEEEILEDASIHLIASASVPSE